MARHITADKSKLTAIQEQSEQIAPFEVPTPPASINPCMWAEWESLIRYLHSQDAWIPEKASVVEIYCINLEALRSAQTRMVLDGGPITAEGKQHPSSMVVARHTGTLTKLAGLLGLGKDRLAAIETDKPQKPGNSAWQA